MSQTQIFKFFKSNTRQAAALHRAAASEKRPPEADEPDSCKKAKLEASFEDKENGNRSFKQEETALKEKQVEDESLKGSQENEKQSMKGSQENEEQSMKGSQENKEQSLKGSQENEKQSMKGSQENEEQSMKGSQENKEESTKGSQKKEKQSMKESQENEKQSMKGSQENEKQSMKGSQENEEQSMKGSQENEEQSMKGSQENEEQSMKGSQENEKRSKGDKEDAKQSTKESQKRDEQSVKEDKSEQLPEGKPEKKEATKPKQQQQLLIDSKRPEADDQLLQRLESVRSSTHGLVTGFGASWFRPLQSEFGKPYFVKLAEFVRNERARGVVYPPAGDVFSWTRACRMQDVKVVVLGQDPYHGPNQAHGLCFSVKRPTASPPSLLNIFNEARANFPGQFESPGHGDLSGWAEQGVLLLNAVLTVRRGEPNSHKDKGWETFTDAVVSALNTRLSGLVFILWGSYAQKKGARVDKKKHRVIVGAHPSPLAANRGGFFGKMYFKEANEYLRSVGKRPIDWSHLP